MTDETQRVYITAYKTGYAHEDGEIRVVGTETTDLVDAVREMDEKNYESEYGHNYFLLYRDVTLWKKL